MGVQFSGITPYLVAFMLLLMRCGIAFWMVPGIGGNNLSKKIKLSFAALVALVLTPLCAKKGMGFEVWLILGGMAGELVVGLAMGLVIRMAIYAAEFAGGALGLQMGLAFANVVDPMTNEQGPVTSKMLALIAAMVLVATDGHRMVVLAVAASTTELPPGTGLVALDGMASLVQFFSVATVTGARIAAPVVVALFLANVALGLLARAAPQLHLFMLSFGISIGLGLIILRGALRGELTLFSRFAGGLWLQLSTVVGM